MSQSAAKGDRTPSPKVVQLQEAMTLAAEKIYGEHICKLEQENMDLLSQVNSYHHMYSDLVQRGRAQAEALQRMFEECASAGAPSLRGDEDTSMTNLGSIEYPLRVSFDGIQGNSNANAPRQKGYQGMSDAGGSAQGGARMWAELQEKYEASSHQTETPVPSLPVEDYATCSQCTSLRMEIDRLKRGLSDLSIETVRFKQQNLQAAEDTVRFKDGISEATSVQGKPAGRIRFYEDDYKPECTVLECADQLRSWTSPQKVLWTNTCIDKLLNNCTQMMDRHGKGHPEAMVVPLYVYSNSLYHDVLWAVWVPAPESFSGRYSVLSDASTKVLEQAHSFRNNGCLMLSHVSMELQQHMARDDVPPEKIGQPPALVAEYHSLHGDQSLTLYGFKNADTKWNAFSLLRYEDSCINGSPLAASVCWIPGPKTLVGDTSFGIKAGEIPSAPVLEYIFSRRSHEVLGMQMKSKVWRCEQVKDKRAHLLREKCMNQKNQQKFDELIHREYEEYVKDTDAEHGRVSSASLKSIVQQKVDEYPTPLAIANALDVQSLEWGDKHYLLSLSGIPHIILEVESGASAELYRLKRPHPDQPYWHVNAAMRFKHLRQEQPTLTISDQANDKESVSGTYITCLTSNNLDADPAVFTPKEAPETRAALRKRSIRIQGQRTDITVRWDVQESKWKWRMGGTMVRQQFIREEHVTLHVGSWLLAHIKGFIYYLDNALANLGTSDDRICNYRGLSQVSLPTSTYSKGNVVVWAQYSSSSRDQGVACKFAAGDNSTVFILRGTSCRSIAAFSRFSREEEWLYPVNTFFKVTEVLSEEQKQILGKDSSLSLLEMDEVTEIEVYLIWIRSLLVQADSLSTAAVIFQVLKAVEPKSDGLVDLSLPADFREDTSEKYYYEVAVIHTAPECCVVPTTEMVEVPKERIDLVKQIWNHLSGFERATSSLTSIPDMSRKSSVMVGLDFSVSTPTFDDDPGYMEVTEDPDGNAWEAFARLLDVPQGEGVHPQLTRVHLSDLEAKVRLLSTQGTSYGWEICVTLRRSRERPGRAVGDAGAKLLATILEYGVPLERLRLCNNGITDTGASQLLGALRKNTHITQLTLREASPSNSFKMTSLAIKLRCLHNAGTVTVDHLRHVEQEDPMPKWYEVTADALYDIKELNLDFKEIYRAFDTQEVEHFINKMRDMKGGHKAVHAGFLVGAACSAPQEHIRRLLLFMDIAAEVYDDFGESPYVKCSRRDDVPKELMDKLQINIPIIDVRPPEKRRREWQLKNLGFKLYRMWTEDATDIITELVTNLHFDAPTRCCVEFLQEISRGDGDEPNLERLLISLWRYETTRLNTMFGVQGDGTASNSLWLNTRDVLSAMLDGSASRGDEWEEDRMKKWIYLYGLVLAVLDSDLEYLDYDRVLYPIDRRPLDRKQCRKGEVLTWETPWIASFTPPEKGIVHRIRGVQRGIHLDRFLGVEFKGQVLVAPFHVFTIASVQSDRAATYDLICHGTIQEKDFELRAWIDSCKAELAVAIEAFQGTCPERDRKTNLWACPLHATREYMDLEEEKLREALKGQEERDRETLIEFMKTREVAGPYTFYFRKKAKWSKEEQSEFVTTIRGILSSTSTYSFMDIRREGAKDEMGEQKVFSNLTFFPTKRLIPYTKRPAFTLLALLGRDYKERSELVPEIPNVALEDPLQSRKDIAVELTVNAATIDRVAREAREKHGVRDTWFDELRRDPSYPKKYLDDPDGPPAAEVYGDAEFRITVGELQELQKSYKVTSAEDKLPVLFVTELRRRFTAVPEYRRFFCARRSLALSNIGDEREWASLRQRWTQLVERAEADLKTLREKRPLANTSAKEMNRYYGDLYDVVIAENINKCNLKHLEQDLEANRRIAQSFETFRSEVIGDPKKFGFNSMEDAIQVMAGSLLEHSTSICTSMRGYFMLGGLNGNHNQLVSKPKLPVVFLSASGLDFCAALSTELEAEKYFKRVDGCKDGDKGWRGFKDGSETELEDRIRALYTAIFTRARAEGVRNPSMLPLGMGQFLTNLTDPEDRKKVRAAYFKVQFSLLCTEDWGFENYFLNPTLFKDEAKAVLEELLRPGQGMALKCNVIFHNCDSKYLAAALASKNMAPGFLNPSDSQAFWLGLLGLYWETGRGSCYAGEEEFVATSTACLSCAQLCVDASWKFRHSSPSTSHHPAEDP